MLASQRSLYCYFLGDDNNDPSDPSDLKSNQKSAKSGDLCVEIKLGKIKSDLKYIGQGFLQHQLFRQKFKY